MSPGAPDGYELGGWRWAKASEHLQLKGGI
jgi:hypothetical protein